MKTISLSLQLYNLVLAKARQIGVSVTDYVRHLVIDDVTKEIVLTFQPETGKLFIE